MPTQNPSRLRGLSDDELHASSVRAAKNERAALHNVLEHLAEVHRRRAFSPEYVDIKDYAIRKLRYDDKSAWTRTNAMFTMLEMPEIVPSIESGELCLTAISVVSRHFRIENDVQPLTRDEKLEVFESVKGKSIRQIERELIDQSSAPEKMEHRETVKVLAGTSNAVSLVLSDDDLQVLQEIKDLLAHSHPTADRSKIVSLALIRARDQIRKEKSKALKTSENQSRSEADEYTRSEVRAARSARSFSNEVTRHIWNESEGKCTQCGSKRALQGEHKIPFAKGGKSTRENSTLLCRNCNQRAAIKEYGLKKMQLFLS